MRDLSDLRKIWAESNRKNPAQSNGKYAPYIAGLVARERRRRRQRRERAAQAMEVAWQAAVVLRKHYPVTRVRVFGSVLRPDYFYERSDIDLAVEGLPARDYLRAWAIPQSTLATS